MWNMDPMGLSVSAQGTSIGNAWEINEWLLGYLNIISNYVSLNYCYLLPMSYSSTDTFLLP